MDVQVGGIDGLRWTDRLQDHRSGSRLNIDSPFSNPSTLLTPSPLFGDCAARHAAYLNCFESAAAVGPCSPTHPIAMVVSSRCQQPALGSGMIQPAHVPDSLLTLTLPQRFFADSKPPTSDGPTPATPSSTTVPPEIPRPADQGTTVLLDNIDVL